MTNCKEDSEREYIVRERLIEIDEKGIRHCVCVEVGELIRCKDCKYFAEELCWNVYGRCTPVSDMDYCSCGERKEDDGKDGNPDTY